MNRGAHPVTESNLSPASSSSSSSGETDSHKRKRPNETPDDSQAECAAKNNQAPPSKRIKTAPKPECDDKQTTGAEVKLPSSSSRSSDSKESKFSLDSSPGELWGWMLFEKIEEEINKLKNKSTNNVKKHIALSLKITKSEYSFIQNNRKILKDNKKKNPLRFFENNLRIAIRGRTLVPPDLNSLLLGELLEKTKPTDFGETSDINIRKMNLAKKIIALKIISWTLDKSTKRFLIALRDIFTQKRNISDILNSLGNLCNNRETTYFNLACDSSDAEISDLQEKLATTSSYQGKLASKTIYLKGKQIWPIIEVVPRHIAGLNIEAVARQHSGLNIEAVPMQIDEEEPVTEASPITFPHPFMELRGKRFLQESSSSSSSSSALPNSQHFAADLPSARFCGSLRRQKPDAKTTEQNKLPTAPAFKL